MMKDTQCFISTECHWVTTVHDFLPQLDQCSRQKNYLQSPAVRGWCVAYECIGSPAGHMYRFHWAVRTYFSIPKSVLNLSSKDNQRSDSERENLDNINRGDE